MDGYKYFLTVVDDASRFTWVFLLKQKSDVQQVFPDFCTMIATQFNVKIKCVRSDNAHELQFTEFYQKHGIIFQKSCVDRPQQNSVVERKHQHLLNVSRALLFQSNVPLAYWSDCILTATYLINRTPSFNLKDKTPFEILMSKPPVYDHLKVFGCLAYVSTLPKTRHKFSPRASPCVFLGYPAGYKGYKLLDLITNKILISRDVIFYESVFPFFDSSFSLHHSSSATTDVFDNISKLHDSTVPITDLAASGSSNNDKSLDSVFSSKRVSKKPAYLSDYTCNTLVHDHNSTISYPISQVVCYDRLSSEHRKFVNSITSAVEPESYKQATLDPKWQEAMDSELRALELNGTWTIESLPAGKKAVGCKWVYKVKHQADGTVEHSKARLVAKGYIQQEGVDYFETFSPVVKMATIKTLLALSAIKGWHMAQLDVNNAFLHGDLEEEVFMQLPPGFKPTDGSLPLRPVCRLRKSIYGLKQASRQWYSMLSTALLDAGFVHSTADFSLFLKHHESHFMAVLVYVDDLVIIGDDLHDIDSFKVTLDTRFKLKDLGDLKFFLGLEVARSKEGIVLHQHRYTLELLKESGFLACKPCSTPMDANIKIAKDSGELLTDVSMYRRLLGKLQYLTISRPNIAYAVNSLSQFVEQPRNVHLKTAQRILQYLKGSVGQGLIFRACSELVLTAYADADWASCVDTRRSVSGVCIFIGSSLVSWKSKKQPIVSRSSAEAEYRAMALAAAELTWFGYLLADLHIKIDGTPILYCDNKSALHIASNPVFHERTKHIELDCHYVREKVQEGKIRTAHISSSTQIADIFTKPLFPSFFTEILLKMGVINIHSPS